ncbi:MAG: ubiquitin-protein ligase E3 [Amphiamblys sp. WSBS2006]|nr:MAG: ubiquitin-protein ligase E3 [Amphiamblys sp. WSBS2006]
MQGEIQRLCNKIKSSCTRIEREEAGTEKQIGDIKDTLRGLKELVERAEASGQQLGRSSTRPLGVVSKSAQTERTVWCVLEYFYKHGHADIGDTLCSEAGIKSETGDIGELRRKQVDAEEIRRSMKSETEPQNIPFIPAVDFLIKYTQCVCFLLQFDTASAVSFLREHMGAYFPTHRTELKELAGAVCYFKDRASAQRGPYREMLTEKYKQRLIEKAARKYFQSVSLSTKSVVDRCVHAVVSSACPNGSDIEAFHSAIFCPVTKELTTHSNPPFLLACGHVISDEGHTGLSRHGLMSGPFKCPYCSKECHHDSSVVIDLP